MRIQKRKTVEDKCAWHVWFAWYPVSTKHAWVWLERVTRRRVYDVSDYHWEYL